MFINREEAGQLLSKELLKYKDQKNTIIMAIPRGGVPVGYEIAEKLNLPLDIVLAKKIGHPYNKEYAIGSITLENAILDDSAQEVSTAYITDETKQIRQLLKQRFEKYYGSNKPIELKDKAVIIVDDGVATGNTLISCIKLLEKQKPSEIIVALPVASSSALNKIKELACVSETICLESPRYFSAVGQFYKNFDQVSDYEVMQLLKRGSENYVLKHVNS